MASAVMTPAISAARPARSLKRAKALVNAIVAHRVDQAARELRRRNLPIYESALVHGELRRLPLSKAGLLPFTIEA